MWNLNKCQVCKLTLYNFVTICLCQQIFVPFLYFALAMSFIQRNKFVVSCNSVSFFEIFITTFS